MQVTIDVTKRDDTENDEDKDDEDDRCGGWLRDENGHNKNKWYVVARTNDEDNGCGWRQN